MTEYEQQSLTMLRDIRDRITEIADRLRVRDEERKAESEAIGNLLDDRYSR